MSEAAHSKTIWCLMDGRHGHQNQVLGLADQLSGMVDAHVCCVDLTTPRGRLGTLYRSSRQLSGHAASPDLVIGAGHRTHLPLVVLRHRFAACSVVLMKPSLPFHWFDYCLIPSVHQLETPPDNVLETKGVLNRVQPRTNTERVGGLMLIGGPSAHYRWSDEQICRQIREVLSGSEQPWTIATSRRTPPSFLKALGTCDSALRIVRPEDTDPAWLPSQLSRAESAWVTEDSVSMMYEALTSGASVGVLELSRHRDNRVTECTDLLVRDGDVQRWSAWTKSRHLPRPATTVWEAERCSRELLNRLSWTRHREPEIAGEAA
ncbi:MAG: mitochondrial fission ELM1 family protein [Planctomycetaceae bacterium]|nr:mitochondrial fission ELM1 family protein [Planctomycetaceae bacterium]